MKIYVSGPMTGMPDLNFPAFNRASECLRKQGHDVVNPAELNPDTTTSWADCLRRDITAMLDCEAIHLLPGWQNSKGARLEKHVADQLGIKVVLSEGATSFDRVELLIEVGAEVSRAQKHGDRFASLHEAYAVILEELDEVWDLTRMKRRDRDPEAIRRELIQIAAMAVKAIESIDNFVGGSV